MPHGRSLRVCLLLPHLRLHIVYAHWLENWIWTDGSQIDRLFLHRWQRVTRTKKTQIDVSIWLARSFFRRLQSVCSTFALMYFNIIRRGLISDDIKVYYCELRTSLRGEREETNGKLNTTQERRSIDFSFVLALHRVRAFSTRWLLYENVANGSDKYYSC